MEAESSSRDLLNRFAGITNLSDHQLPATTSELSLGLSLGGCFSSNPREKTNFLIRSSSVSSYPNHFFNGHNITTGSSNIKEEMNINIHVLPTNTTTTTSSSISELKRTYSMPVPGADEDYKKRKVLQTLKRLEAKRKRNEKRMNIMNSGNIKGEEAGSSGSRPSAWMLPPLSHGSLGSPGSTSGSSGGAAAGSGSMQGLDNTIKKIERGSSGVSELDMPCVTTRGNGPDGKKIEGFLYKYKKGEEVRIVCVCHGKFLTPAEFVRHAGGGDVDNPMRHIIVSKPSSPLL